MVESEPKKIGRPKSEQTVPLIFTLKHPRVTRAFTLDASVAQLIEDYASWAAGSGGTSIEEARLLLIGRAVDAFIRKDALFRNHLQTQKGTQQS